VAPFVSAVTIVRDGERFLTETIESVLGQTYRSLELVIVDDGSTDRSAEIAERFVRVAPDRVRLVRDADGGTRGMSAARALGVQAAQGDLIGFLPTGRIRRAPRGVRCSHGIRSESSPGCPASDSARTRSRIPSYQAARTSTPAPRSPAAQTGSARRSASQ
jgi:hypothetical protein